MKKKRGPTAQGFLDNIKRRVRTTVGDHFIEQLLLLLASGSLTAAHLCRDARSSPVWRKISCLNTHSNETSTPADTRQTGRLSQELELKSHCRRSQNSLFEQGGGHAKEKILCLIDEVRAFIRGRPAYLLGLNLDLWQLLHGGLCDRYLRGRRSGAGPLVNVAKLLRQTLHINLSVGADRLPATRRDVTVWRSGCETEAKDYALIKLLSSGALDLKDRKGQGLRFHCSKSICLFIFLS